MAVAKLTRAAITKESLKENAIAMIVVKKRRIVALTKDDMIVSAHLEDMTRQEGDRAGGKGIIDDIAMIVMRGQGMIVEMVMKIIEADVEALAKDVIEGVEETGVTVTDHLLRKKCILTSKSTISITQKQILINIGMASNG